MSLASWDQDVALIHTVCDHLNDLRPDAVVTWTIAAGLVDLAAISVSPGPVARIDLRALRGLDDQGLRQVARKILLRHPNPTGAP